ncbi:enoyl-CoA hydratase [Leptospira dzoumogneensis]|uniref:Enoyl-CoA hydratase n=2 Tax=Leptospira dzoumogneensis TaxID=2484904 RepID=A0A4Z1ASG1_9LEPT|nr:enoyl-CoA hydratase [Leptospira dzoumogneensis]
MDLLSYIGMSDLPLITNIHDVPGGKIFQITMNRPEVHNAVNKEMADLFVEAWKTFQKDQELTVAVLHGAGDKAFCSGADLSGLDKLANVYLNKEEREEYAKNDPGPLGGSRIVQKKPVITVSHGYTYAGGLELFCHGHIRIAEPQAIFSVACRRWGVPLVDGGTVYLPRLLGWGSALPLILTGQRIRAERAYQLGLVWELVKKGKGLERAFSYATQLCKQPRDAMFADLNSALEGWNLPLQEALTVEARNTFPVMESKSTKEGVKRFLDGDRFWFR